MKTATNRRITSEMNSTPSQQCVYDALLEEFLPVIHKAAHSVASHASQTDGPYHLLLAGLQGLKQAFLQHSDADRMIGQDIIIQNIYESMREELESVNLNAA